MNIRIISLVICIFHPYFVSSKSFNRLNGMIRHFEPLHYDKEALHENHERTKRSTTETHRLEFNAFGKEFHLVLKRDIYAIASDVFITTSRQGAINYDQERTYRGHVEGQPGSTLHGIITPERTFEGRITLADEIYNVERASKYFDEGQDFHSVIYRNSDIEHDKVRRNTSCASEELHQKQHQLYSSNRAELNRMSESHLNKEFNGNKYTSSANYQRKKRAIDVTKKQCTLYVQIDYTYYEYWGSEVATVIDEVVTHIQGANEIYEATDFDQDAAGRGDGINFILKKLHIWDDPSDPDYKFDGSYSVEAMLSLFSEEEDWNDFCLVYIFNHRDFDGGVLGLAYTGDPDADGGVCEEWATYSGVQMSLNTGLITILNYGEVMPHSISIITFAHELGHNMGSQHDQDGSDCAPGGSDGNYIMYAYAIDGTKPNNNKFSPCSIDSMHTVMATDARDEDNGCFHANVDAICGNKLVEDGEACDCGYADQCHDTCCDAITCALVDGASCSPSNHPCCEEENCAFTPAEDNRECRALTGCTGAAYCNGSSGECPASENAPNGTYCNEGKQVCVSGECSGSVCFRANMVQCQCEGKFDKKTPCQLCCAPEGEEENNCQSSFDLDILNSTYALPGSPCKNYKGYCDSHDKCRRIYPESSFKALMAIFSKEGIKSLRDFLKTRWYYPVVATVVFIILLVLVIKFGKPKKKTDKKKKDKDKDKGKKPPGPKPRKRGPPPKKF